MVTINRCILCIVALIGYWEGTVAYRDLDWWETTLIYQIYPRSFKDSNGDGIGDLNGIFEKLDYIKDIGIETVWIQPFYASPMFDMGYDVADFKKVDPLFGTIEDYKKLVQGIHDRGMKLMVDLVPNHMSSQSQWFKLSENGVEPYKDYFLWANPKYYNATHSTYPNNWLSVFGGSAWTWSEKRKQYYYKQFADRQPDLNFRNPKVQQEILNVLKFWLDTGVDGFRVDAIKHVFEAEHMKDEPKIKESDNSGNDFETLDHIYTQEQPENYELTHSWRTYLDEYAKKDGQTRILCTEDYDIPEKLVKYMGNSSYPNVQIPFYFEFVRFYLNNNAKTLDTRVRDWIETLPKNTLPNWVLDNHDNFRVSTRLNSESVDAWNMLTLLMPGAACVYFGTELGLEDSPIREDQRRDPNNGGMGRTDSRDPSRAPMIWDDSPNAGFTTNEKPWLPVSPTYWRKNVKTQLEASNSHLKIFKRLAALRKTPVIRHGDFHSFALSSWVYMFTRSIDKETIAVIVNLGSELDQICAKHLEPSLPDNMVVHTSSLNSGYNVGDKVKISDEDKNICSLLRPKAGLVLTSNGGELLFHSLYLVFLAATSSLLRWSYF